MACQVFGLRCVFCVCFTKKTVITTYYVTKAYFTLFVMNFAWNSSVLTSCLSVCCQRDFFFFWYAVSWNVGCYLRRMLMHVNFKCYELSTFSFNCLIVFFTRVNGCWRQRSQCLGARCRGGRGWWISPPHLFSSRSYTVGNVVSEYLDLRKITGNEWVREWE